MNNNDTPTPRTDEVENPYKRTEIDQLARAMTPYKGNDDCAMFVSYEKAKELETKLATVTKSLDEYKQALESADKYNDDLGIELEKTREERDELKKLLRDANRGAEKNSKVIDLLAARCSELLTQLKKYGE